MIIAFAASFVVSILVFFFRMRCIEKENDHIKDVLLYLKRQDLMNKGLTDARLIKATRAYRKRKRDL